MNIREIKINESIYLFTNKSEGTRGGFKHESHLHLNGREIVRAYCHYINRTWEKYEFQTVMIEAVYLVTERVKERITLAFKEENKLSRIGPRTQILLNKKLRESTELKEYAKLRNKLEDQ